MLPTTQLCQFKLLTDYTMLELWIKDIQEFCKLMKHTGSRNQLLSSFSLIGTCLQPVVERVLVVAQQRAHGAGSLAVAASRYRRHPGGGSRSFVVASEASRDAVGRRDRAPAAWSAVRGGAAVAGGGHGCRRRIASSRRGQWGGAPSRWRRTEGWQQGREEEVAATIRVCPGSAATLVVAREATAL